MVSKIRRLVRRNGQDTLFDRTHAKTQPTRSDAPSGYMRIQRRVMNFSSMAVADDLGLATRTVLASVSLRRPTQSPEG